jgi:hypothetical protein
MSLSIYDISVPVLLHSLETLSAVLEKGRAHAEAEKFDPTVLLSTRLYPDMFDFTRQVQVVCDQAKNSVARLAGVEPPKHEDNETSFPELQERIAKTVAYLRGFSASQIAGAESRPIVLKFPNRSLNFKTGTDYLLSFVLPNVYFHSAMAYGILRHCGVKLGKSDFIGRIGNND